MSSKNIYSKIIIKFPVINMHLYDIYFKQFICYKDLTHAELMQCFNIEFKQKYSF